MSKRKNNIRHWFDINDIIIDKRTGKEYLFAGYLNGYYSNKVCYVREVSKSVASTGYTEYFKLKKKEVKND